MADKIKFLAALLVLAAAVGGFYYYADQAQLFRVLGMLAAVGVAGAIALQTEKGAAGLAYARTAIIEVRKVVWPSRKETVQTTLVVMAMVLVIGLVLWMFDTFLLWAVRMLTGQEA